MSSVLLDPPEHASDRPLAHARSANIQAQLALDRAVLTLANAALLLERARGMRLATSAEAACAAAVRPPIVYERLPAISVAPFTL